MNRYPIWIGLTVAFVMVCLTSNSIWWMILAVGAGMNGVVSAANGWKMPVRGLLEESIRHAPLVPSTRYKWLADVIPIWAGKASVGDFVACAGIMGAWATRDSIPVVKIIIALWLLWYAAGWAGGFRLFDKWTAGARRDARKNVPIILLLMIVGNLLHVPGCSLRQLHASVAETRQSVKAVLAQEAPHLKPKAESKWRDLGKLATPSLQMLKRLRLAEADHDAKAVQAQRAKALLDAPIEKQIAEIQRDPISHVQRKRLRDLQKEAGPTIIAEGNATFLFRDSDGAIARWTFNNPHEVLAPAPPQSVQQWTVQQWTKAVMIASGAQRIGARKGPFCRVTCSFHHNDNQGAGIGDVEVDSGFCNAERIDPSLSEVMGWIAIDEQYETQNPWPGPAGGGLDSYKLYWSSPQRKDK